MECRSDSADDAHDAADVDDAEGDDMGTTSPEALSQGKTACEKAGPWQFLE